MIEILTSGVALGVHVPGLLLAERLRERDTKVTVSVLERLLPERTRNTTERMKWAFHRDFRVALTGQSLAGDASTLMDHDALDALGSSWHERDVTRFVVFSGFWLPIVERLTEAFGTVPPIDVCHVDSVRSPSFRAARPTTLPVRDVWLADADHGTLPCSIPVSREPAVPWAERAQRLLVHGGGWGMGTYREHAVRLRAQGFELDLVAYEPGDVRDGDHGVRYFMIDPDWHPWLDDGFPPFGQVGPAGIHYTRGTGYHRSFELTRTALATVSKPGGGTLLDSLWSATPMVLLEPFGAHERRNAELWERLGFGVPLERWHASRFDIGLLEEMHHNLRAARECVPDYSERLASV